MTNLTDIFFASIAYLDEILWQYIALWIMIAAGVYFTIRSRGLQFLAFARFFRYIKELHNKDPEAIGTNPLKLYFASIGGMIGLGNIVIVTTTVTMGGPGSLIWMWIASAIGMIVKYSEIYCGILYRVRSKKGYNGGPMYYLRIAFNNDWLPKITCFLLCIYGTEVVQFLILTDTMVKMLYIERKVAVTMLLFLVFVSSIGGVRLLANICTITMPIFVTCYVLVGTWIILDNYDNLISILQTVWHSAWHGHAAVNGFAGSTMLMAAQYGVSRAVYSGDIGIGYDSIIQSETRADAPHKQARMAIYALFTDTLICTISVLIIMVTGIWTQKMDPSDYVLTAISPYIPYAQYFIFLLFFIAGFTTIIAYTVVGQKCAYFLSPKYGRKIYCLYAGLAFIFFSFHDQTKVNLIMSFSGGMLMVINLIGILKLSSKIKFL